MILRAAIVVVLMLNLGVAAWWLGGAGSHRAAIPAPIDKSQPGLRLVSESVAAKPVVMPPDSASTQSAADATAAENLANLAVPLADSALCLSFGPFADAAARDAAGTRLQSLAQKMLARDAQARAARGWRVYVPALASREAAQTVVETIKAAGINDWYIIATGDDANSIALGRYGSEESAR
ncbi:MAG: SPOR domain-containing protein, partial [Pseudomonadota bacterium]|nr:SPOR domain-containing protein [Pseudomonadota bacterium]